MRRIVAGCVALCILAACCIPEKDATGSFRFAAAGNSATKPAIDTLVVEVAAPEERAGRARWVRVDARADGRVFGYEILVADTDFLHDENARPRILRYILYPSQGPPVESVRARDGAALAPRTLRDWLPRPRGDDLEAATFLGRPFRRIPGTPAPGTWPRHLARREVLDPDLLIATSRPFRDDGSPRAGKDFRWKGLVRADYGAMGRAGFNVFRVEPVDLGTVLDLPAFFVAMAGWNEHPELPLRPGFLGAVMYADEPAVHVMGGWGFKPAGSPAEIARAIATETGRVLTEDDRYGGRVLENRLAASGCNYGAVEPPPYPVWEAIASAAWYELEAGAAGWCYQARIRPEEFAQDVRRALGIAFPDDAAACVQFHLALARGAARRFEAPWGVSVFGQMDAAAADLLFPLAYDAGATWFWIWTSDGDHHVPHARQLELARAVRRHAAEHPRGDPAELTRAAPAAVVLPWGYALDDYTLGRYSDEPYVWNVPALPLSAVNEAGVPHRDVLRAAVGEVVALLAEGRPFDVLFLRDGEAATGYTDVRRVDLAGRVARSGGQ